MEERNTKSSSVETQMDGEDERTLAAGGVVPCSEVKKPMEHGDPEKGTPEDSISIPESTPPEVLPLFRRVVIFVAVGLSIFLTSLDMTIVATAIPAITDEFHSLSSIGWYGSAFLLTAAAFQSTWGKAFKFFPLKTTFLATIIVFELGSLICGVAQNNTTFIVGRAIAGMGGAGIGAGAYTIIAFMVKAEQRPAFMGILGAAHGVASAIGPLLGGVFTDRLSFRWCFYINLPLGGAASAIIVLFFQTPNAAKIKTKTSFREKALQLDLLGMFATMAAVVSYLLAMQWGGVTYAWNSGRVMGTLVGFGLLTLVCVVLEWKLGDRAMFVTRLLRQPAISISLAVTFFLSGAFFLLFYYIPIYFQAVEQVSPLQSGVQTLPMVISLSLSTILSGLLVSKIGQYLPFILGGSVMLTIGAGLIYTLDVGSPSSQWIGYQVLAGLGHGLAVQIPIVIAQSVVQPSDISSVSGMILFARIMGGAIMISAAQSAFANVLIRELPLNAPGVDVSQVVATGATDLRNIFPSDDIPGILQSYVSGLHTAYAIAVASAGMATFTAIFLPWHSLAGLKRSIVA